MEIVELYAALKGKERASLSDAERLEAGLALGVGAVRGPAALATASAIRRVAAEADGDASLCASEIARHLFTAAADDEWSLVLRTAMEMELKYL